VNTINRKPQMNASLGIGYADQASNGCSAVEGQRRDPTVVVTVELKANRNFSDALMWLFDGKRVTRAGWNAGGQYVELAHGPGMVFLALTNAQGHRSPWTPSTGDLFANDWVAIPN
jgi:hypothetical protein